MENIDNADLVRVLKFCYDLDQTKMYNCRECPVREIARDMEQDCERVLIGEVVRRLGSRNAKELD